MIPPEASSHGELRNRTSDPLTDQPADTEARMGRPSSWRPHGGFAFTTRPGRQVATKLAKRVDGWRARIR